MDWFEKGVWDQRHLLKRLALKAYRHPDDAEDAVSETMTRALKNRRVFAKGTNLAGWLSTILLNGFRTNVRRAWTQRVTLSDDPRYADHIPAADDPERAMIVKETYDAFAGELVEAQKNTLMLIGLGFSYRQVAAHENISEGAVKSRAKRGRDRLAEMVGAF